MTSGERHAPEPVGPFVVGAHEQHRGVSGATFWQTFQRGQEARLVFFLNRVVKRHHQHCCCKVGVSGGGERRFKNFGELPLLLVYSSVDLVHLALLGVATRSLSAGRQKSVRSVLWGGLGGERCLSPRLAVPNPGTYPHRAPYEVQAFRGPTLRPVPSPSPPPRCRHQASSWRAASIVSEAGVAYSCGIPALSRPSRRSTATLSGLVSSPESVAASGFRTPPWRARRRLAARRRSTVGG